MSRAPETDALYLRWGAHFNERIASDAWDDDPWTELAVILHTLAIPDPFPGTNDEWEMYFRRALDRFEVATEAPLDPRMRALLRAIHPCRAVTSDTGNPEPRA